jgi:ribose 5-phosphate isomerase B
MEDNILNIPIACDHAGFELKEKIKFQFGNIINFVDFGTFSTESVDYPDMIHPLAKAIDIGTYNMGIIICGSGNGVAITANKYKNVRAAICWIPEIAKLARQHNDANIVSLPARFISEEEAFEIVKMFINTEFEGGRHKVRVDKISATL